MVVIKSGNTMDEVSPLSNVATFILKLWKMLQNKEALDIMCWNINGKSFIIMDQVAFITKLLPMYFKHNNMGSFIRQLNLYDFHKIGLENKNAEVEYQHKYFQQNRPELLKYIKRKLPQGSRKVVFSQVDAKEIENLSKEVTGIKNKQEEMARQLNSLQKENLGLLKELGSLHTKQNSQTQVLKKIIELLIPFVDTYSSAHNKPSTETRPNMIDQDGSSARIFEISKAINNQQQAGPSTSAAQSSSSFNITNDNVFGGNLLMDIPFNMPTSWDNKDLAMISKTSTPSNNSMEKLQLCTTDTDVVDGFIDLKDVIGNFSEQQMMMDDASETFSPSSAVTNSSSPKDDAVASTSYVVEEMEDATDKDTLNYLDNTFSSLLENDILSYKENADFIVVDDSSSNN